MDSQWIAFYLTNDTHDVGVFYTSATWAPGDEDGVDYHGELEPDACDNPEVAAWKASLSPWDARLVDQRTIVIDGDPMAIASPPEDLDFEPIC